MFPQGYVTLKSTQKISFSPSAHPTPLLCCRPWIAQVGHVPPSTRDILSTLPFCSQASSSISIPPASAISAYSPDSASASVPHPKAEITLEFSDVSLDMNSIPNGVSVLFSECAPSWRGDLRHCLHISKQLFGLVAASLLENIHLIRRIANADTASFC